MSERRRTARTTGRESKIYPSTVRSSQGPHILDLFRIVGCIESTAAMLQEHQIEGEEMVESWLSGVRTAAIAPLSRASVKMSSTWEASVAFASQETRAIQGVVADDRGSGCEKCKIKELSDGAY